MTDTVCSDRHSGRSVTDRPLSEERFRVNTVPTETATLVGVCRVPGLKETSTRQPTADAVSGLFVRRDNFRSRNDYKRPDLQ